MRGKLFFAVAAALLWTSAAHAQAGDPSAATEAGCELHVWPASGLNSVYYGWLHGGINNGAVTGRDGYPQVPTDPMDVASQVSLLTEAQPHILIQRPNHRLIVHTEALASRAIRTSTTRLIDSASPCYSELIVDDVFFQQDVFSGSYLKISFRFRDFGNAASPQRVFGTWVDTRLHLFPTKPGQDLAAPIEEMKAAYREDISLFAAALLKPPKAKKRG